MLRIQKDESIHSFIYRTHIINGIPSFENIITLKGFWKRYPSILKSTLHLYEPIQEHLIFELLNQISYFPAKPTIFDLSQEGFRELEQFFSGDEVISNNSNSFLIKYCDACFAEQLVSVGFTYFKNQWLKSKYCENHNQKLILLNASTYSQSVKKLTNIHNVKATNTKKISKIEETKLPENQLDNCAPCMGEMIYKYSLLRLNDYPKSVFDYKGVSSEDIRQPHMLHQIYCLLKEERHRCYDELMEYAVQKVVDGGYIDKSSIPINFYKLKISDCSNCHFSGCIANTTIKYAKKLTTFSNDCERNIRILYGFAHSKRHYTFKAKRNFVESLSLDEKQRIISNNKYRYTYLEPYLE